MANPKKTAPLAVPLAAAIIAAASVIPAERNPNAPETALAALPAVGADDAPDEEQGDAPPVNRWDSLFERIAFTPVDSDTIYEGEDRKGKKNGKKSRKLATVTIVYRGGFGATSGSVYVKKNGDGAPFVEFTFMGTQNGSTIKALDDGAKAELSDWKLGVVKQYAAWRQGQGPAASAPRTTAAVDAATLGIDL